MLPNSVLSNSIQPVNVVVARVGRVGCGPTESVNIFPVVRRVDPGIAGHSVLTKIHEKN